MRIKLEDYYRLLDHLNIKLDDAYKFFFWDLDSKQGKQRPRKKYMEEYRQYYLDCEYNQRLQYHKCIGKYKERYVVFKESNKIYIDPWEFIQRRYTGNFSKIKETAADHVFFEVLYAIPNYDFVYNETRFLILKLLEFCNLYPSTDYSSGLRNPSFQNLVGESWIDRNRFCIKCGVPIEYDIRQGIALTCISPETKNRKSYCYDNFAKQSTFVKFSEPDPKFTIKHYKEFFNKLSYEIISVVRKTQKKQCTRKGYIPSLSSAVKALLEDSANIKDLQKLIKKAKPQESAERQLFQSFNELLISKYPDQESYTWAKFLLNLNQIQRYL